MLWCVLGSAAAPPGSQGSSAKLQRHSAAGCEAVIRTGERDLLDCWQPHFQGGAASGAHPVSLMCLEPYSERLQQSKDALSVRHMPEVSVQALWPVVLCIQVLLQLWELEVSTHLGNLIATHYVSQLSQLNRWWPAVLCSMVCVLCCQRWVPSVSLSASGPSQLTAFPPHIVATPCEPFNNAYGVWSQLSSATSFAPASGPSRGPSAGS